MINQTPNRGRTPDYSRDAVDDLRRFLQHHASQLAPLKEPAADAGFNIAQTKAIFSPSCDLYWGFIQSTVPHTGSYVVSLSGLGLQVVCRMVNVSGTVATTQDTSTLSTGTEVLIALDKRTQLGTIICTRATATFDAAFVYCDTLSTESVANFYANPLHKILYEKLLDHKFRVPDTLHRPVDAIAGDKTWSTVTGVTLHVDPELAMLKASEICGLFLFREEGQTRLSGEVLELESLSKQEKAGLINGELSGYCSIHAYPWESMGYSKKPESMPVKQGSPENAYSAKAPYEAQPDVPSNYLARVASFEGYAGQGIQTYTQVRNEIGEGNPVRSALSKQWAGTDGTLLFESVNQVHLAKPYLIWRPDVNFESTEKWDDYSPNNDDQEITTPGNREEITSDSVAPELIYAYASWMSYAGLIKRPDLLFSKGASNPTIDNRPDGKLAQYSLKLQKVLSLISILPNGDVALQCGKGGQIVLSEDVQISGINLFLNSKETCAVLSNRISLRAQHDAEVSSSLDSVRIKAEKNLLCLAGNGGTGGLVLESRSRGDDTTLDDKDPGQNEHTGITIRSLNSYVSVHGGSLLMKTGPANAGAVNGKILLDAGNNEIVSMGSVQRRYATAQYLDHFGTSASIQTTNVHLSTYSMFGGNLGINRSLIVGGSVQAGTGYSTAAGHYASPDSQKYRGLVGVEKFPDRIRESINSLNSSVQSANSSGKEQLEGIRDEFRADNKPLNPDIIKRGSFGFPTSYKLPEDKKIKRPYWQQDNIRTNAQPWFEPGVQYELKNGPVNTGPWPGYDTWNSEIIRTAESKNKLLEDGAIVHPRNKIDDYQNNSLTIKDVTPDQGFYVGTE